MTLGCGARFLGWHLQTHSQKPTGFARTSKLWIWTSGICRNSYRPSGWPVYNRVLWCDSTVHISICDDNHVTQHRGDISQWLEQKTGRESSHHRAHDRDVRKPTTTPLTIEKHHIASWGFTIFIHEYLAQLVSTKYGNPYKVKKYSFHNAQRTCYCQVNQPTLQLSNASPQNWHSQAACCPLWLGVRLVILS